MKSLIRLQDRLLENKMFREYGTMLMDYLKNEHAACKINDKEGYFISRRIAAYIQSLERTCVIDVRKGNLHQSLDIDELVRLIDLIK